MRTWGRATIDRTCGYCGQSLPIGGPVLAIALGAGKKKIYLYRGPCCEGPAPPDLPADVNEPKDSDLPRGGLGMVGSAQLAQSVKRAILGRPKR